ncbi:MAG: TetR/AcrR family transcriptional regulator [Alphaproteobacteria bacterium]
MNKPSAPTAAPMGRRARKKAETRARIFEAAVSLFLRDGYHGVTIEQICEAADVANGTFFLHFPTKTDLLVEFSEQLNDRIAARLETATGTPEDRLWAFREAMVAEWDAHAGFMRDVVQELRVGPSPDVAARTANTLHALARALIAEGQALGDFSKEFDPALAATTILAGWNGITVSWSKSGNWDQAAQANEAVLKLVLRGLKA